MGAQGSAGRQPGTPTIGTATTSASQTVEVSFTAPTYLGKPTGTSYIATSDPGNITGTSSTSPVTVTGLTNGTAYTFTVKLNNGVVDSLPSAASNSVTPIVPGPFFPPFFPFFPYFPFFPTFLPCTPGEVCSTGTNYEPQGPCDYVVAWSSTCTCTVSVSYVCY